MTMITPSYLGETIEYSSLHACRSTLEDPTLKPSPSKRKPRRQSPNPSPNHNNSHDDQIARAQAMAIFLIQAFQ